MFVTPLSNLRKESLIGLMKKLKEEEEKLKVGREAGKSNGGINCEKVNQIADWQESQ